VTSGSDGLARLHRELTARLTPLGFEPERRPYSAHLTIARVKDVGGPSRASVRTMLNNRRAIAGKCRIEAVTIFRSRVSSKGATYEVLKRVELK
jgi:2'-5' RNA ligase